jgi:hypothetical protein
MSGGLLERLFSTFLDSNNGDDESCIFLRRHQGRTFPLHDDHLDASSVSTGLLAVVGL